MAAELAPPAVDEAASDRMQAESTPEAPLVADATRLATAFDGLLCTTDVAVLVEEAVLVFEVTELAAEDFLAAVEYCRVLTACELFMLEAFCEKTDVDEGAPLLMWERKCVISESFKGGIPRQNIDQLNLPSIA